jgi:hypothetical protein
VVVSRELCCCHLAVATTFVPSGSGGCNSSEPVGVALLRDSIDIAEPGRGLGLGLGGASLALAPSLSSSPPISNHTAVPSNVLESPSRRAPGAAPELAATPGQASEKSSGSGASVANRSVLVLDGPSALPRGVRPAARTFFRALNPMQSTNCRIASRSDTGRRRGAVRVRLSVLAHEPVRMPGYIGVASSPLSNAASVGV